MGALYKLMTENIFDIALLLSPVYLCKKYNTTIQKILSQLCLDQSKLLVRVVKHLRDLTGSTDLNFLSKLLCLPVYFIEIILSINPECGTCNVCNTYFTKLKRHLGEVHFLSLELIKHHRSLYSDSQYFYMPKDYRTTFEGYKVKQPNLSKSQLFRIDSKVIYDAFQAQSETYPNTLLLQTPTKLCGECGMIVEVTKINKHQKNHRRNQQVLCPKCKICYKRRYLSDHLKYCVSN
jgi:hypothetical protein